mmetsp:Transcript_101911/g.161102  ORF Transcript_101911/g.161102 Transcript_101911/m.161102 type:complete len:162 (+) Transcript_101911:51-536(+)
MAFPNGDDTVVEFQMDNPKKIGSEAWERYESYKMCTTIREAKKDGATSSDLKQDLKNGYVVIMEASIKKEETENAVAVKTESAAAAVRIASSLVELQKQVDDLNDKQFDEVIAFLNTDVVSKGEDHYGLNLDSLSVPRLLEFAEEVAKHSTEGPPPKKSRS